MIQYGDRIGFITHEHAKRGKVDLYLLPNSMHPEARLVTLVDPSKVTLAKIPNAMNEITGLDRKSIGSIGVDDMLSRAKVVRMREGETREEALARGRAEIAEEIDASYDHPDDDEPETDEVGRTPEEVKE